MGSLNRVFLMGNLTRDVEMRMVGTTACASFGLAVNRKFKDKTSNEWREEVTFVDITVWAKLAETCQKFLSKGRPVFVEGRLKLDQWDDKATGQKRSKLSIVGEQVQFLGDKREQPQAQPAAASVSGGDDNLEDPFA